MAHNLIAVNNTSPDSSGDISIAVSYGIAGVTTRMIHTASSNTADVGEYAQIHKGIYSIDYENTSLLDWVDADGRAIKSNSNYAMGVQLNVTGAYYIEAVLKFDIDSGESCIIQIVDSTDTPISCKAYYGTDSRSDGIYPSTLHAVINNTSAGDQYFFRVQAVTGSVGQPMPNTGSSYLKVIKL